MYERKSRLTDHQQSKLLEHFVAGTTASVAAKIIGLQPNTAISFYMRLRKLIASKLPSYELSVSGEVDVDDDFLRWRKGVPVFGMLKRGAKVYTAIIANAKTENQIPIFDKKAPNNAIVYPCHIRGFNILKEFRKDLREHLAAKPCKEIRMNLLEHPAAMPNLAEIEHFWNQAEHHLRKFYGIKPENFYWFLKECEWRFNGDNHKLLLNQLKYWYKHSKH